MKATLKSGIREDVKLDLSSRPTLQIELSDGGRIDVELFERSPGLLSIRTVSGCIIVHPRVSNVIEVEAEYKARGEQAK